MVFEGTVALAGLGAVVWAVRQEGRVNTHDQMFKDRDERDDERTLDLKNRLVRIENKLDYITQPSTRRPQSGPDSQN